MILADAYRQAQTIKGEGDAKASAIYAQAYGQNAEFYSFYRSLDAYKSTFRSKSDLMVLDPSADFFQYFKQNGPQRARRARPGEIIERRGKTRVQDSLWTALALLLILEGLLPFVAPRVWREGFRRLTELTDGQLRFVGVVSMGIGLLGLYLLNL